MNKNKISPPIAYLEKTKKKRDEPSSRAIFAEFGTNAKRRTTIRQQKYQFS